MGSSGICSCSHVMGITNPKAAITAHTKTVHCLVSSQFSETSAHFAMRNTVITKTLNSVMEMISGMMEKSVLLLISAHVVVTANVAMICKARNTNV